MKHIMHNVEQSCTVWPVLRRLPGCVLWLAWETFVLFPKCMLKAARKQGVSSQGKRIFEVPTERPKWFSNRLTIKSNVTTSSDTTVAKPTNLANFCGRLK
ncbi:hypothetical protein E2C01_008494 [Portunus trituberculatus]|uniref:Uncharacterized protein n=1 Tax=Portunus trituberculatus TaxID=210409 RepID=A0A5B7D4P2_PORTR|nr:hypothetical protein [Portunus trituberculatus]